MFCRIVLHSYLKIECTIKRRNVIVTLVLYLLCFCSLIQTVVFSLRFFENCYSYPNTLAQRCDSFRYQNSWAPFKWDYINFFGIKQVVNVADGINSSKEVKHHHRLWSPLLSPKFLNLKEISTSRYIEMTYLIHYKLGSETKNCTINS